VDKKYIFECKLAGKPVCVEWSLENGIYANELEQYGVWKPQSGRVLSWIVRYPVIIIYNHTRYEMKIGDTFTLGME
jgi:hypothetical protein